MNGRGGMLALLGGLVACGVIACEPSDVIIANIPADDGGKPVAPAPCVKDADCATDQFCERDSCSDQVGRCHNQPPFCDSTSSTVCGCDGISYWNDCLRAMSGVSKSSVGVCQTGPTCDANNGCPNTKASCAKLGIHPGDCTHDIQGQCWVLPDDCPTDGHPDWLACSGAATCTDVCSAIRAGTPYFHADNQGCP